MKRFHHRENYRQIHHQSIDFNERISIFIHRHILQEEEEDPFPIVSATLLNRIEEEI